MAYRKQLEEAVAWLISVQNQDGGWGIVPGQKSSIVNTSEALYVLKKARRSKLANYENGIKFIESNTFLHVREYGPRVRYVAFALLAFCESHYDTDLNFIQQCVEWLKQAKNDDNGWGTASKDNNSNIFDTFLAIWALQSANVDETILSLSYNWLLSKFVNNGWRFSDNEPVSVVATAYAAFCLANSKEFSTHDNVNTAKNFLLQTRDWEPCEEVMAGTLWKHCSYGWVIPALAALGEDPYCPTISEGVRFINHLYDSNGGWGEGIGQSRKTVRAQFWAVHALSSLQEAFDPGKHILRIDAERAQVALSEPDYIKIGIHSNWATIIPTRIYRYFLYFLLVVAVCFLFGWHRSFSSLPSRMDPLFSAVILVLMWLLVRKREAFFPRWTKIVKNEVDGFVKTIYYYFVDAFLNEQEETKG